MNEPNITFQKTVASTHNITYFAYDREDEVIVIFVENYPKQQRIEVTTECALEVGLINLEFLNKLLII